MSEPIQDGDLLPMVGGPLNGEQYRVEFVFPFLDGGIAPSAVSFGQSGSRYFYMLDREQRAWVYQPKPNHERKATDGEPTDI